MNKGTSLKIPVSGSVTGFEEAEAVMSVMDAKQYAPGRRVEQFEHEFAKYVGKKYGVFVNSGSSANLLALCALIEHTHTYWFVTPATAFPTTINPLIQMGRDITLVDVGIDTLLPGIANYGAMTLGNYHSYPLVEDSCDAMFPGMYTGIAQTFSFFPAHHITTGEGGMVTTDDADFYKIAKSYRDWGRDCWCAPGFDNTCGKRFEHTVDGIPYDHKYIYSRIGYNLNGTEMAAAMGIEQLKKLPVFTQQRILNFNYLFALMKRYDEFFIMPVSTNDNTPWFGYPLIIKDNAPFKRESLMEYLNSKGVGTRLLFAGNIARQPAYKDVRFNYDKPLANSDKLMRDAFWVGCWHGLHTADMQYIAETIGEFIGRL